MGTVGFGLLPFLDETALPEADCGQPLATLGVQSHDWVTVSAGRQTNTFELIAA